MSKYYVNDTPLIKLDAVVDLAGAVDPLIYYEKPDGTIGSWIGIIIDNRYVTYQILTTDVLDLAGEWRFQIHLTLGVWTGYGETGVQKIYQRFK